MLKHDACGEEIQNVQLVSLRKRKFSKNRCKKRVKFKLGIFKWEFTKDGFFRV